ncbi:hypothetical protein BDW72DRAFT_208170 [Aspergillus terricola var. indicus]
MVYMKIHVDGGCRGNGQPGLIGAAAAAFKNEYSEFHGETKKALPSSPTPTNQRAEITSVILVNCMTKWVYKWSNNGWTNSEGSEVANRDLIEEALNRDNLLKEKGDVYNSPRFRPEQTLRIIREKLGMPQPSCFIHSGSDCQVLMT